MLEGNAVLHHEGGATDRMHPMDETYLLPSRNIYVEDDSSRLPSLAILLEQQYQER